jgi:hypothetical protein
MRVTASQTTRLARRDRVRTFPRDPDDPTLTRAVRAQQLLDSVGLRQRERRERVAVRLLLGALLRRARSSAPPMSPSRIEAYYGGHRRRYDRTRPASARRAIALTLAEQDRRQAADRFLSAFRRRQRAQTACARDFSVPSCGRTTPG